MCASRPMRRRCGLRAGAGAGGALTIARPHVNQKGPANEAGPNGGWDACGTGYFFFL